MLPTYPRKEHPLNSQDRNQSNPTSKKNISDFSDLYLLKKNTANAIYIYIFLKRQTSLCDSDYLLFIFSIDQGCITSMFLIRAQNISSYTKQVR